MFNIAGESFDLMDGVLGLSLSPNRGSNADRYLYFHALASTTENILNTNVLRNDSHIGDPNLEPHLVYVSDERFLISLVFLLLHTWVLPTESTWVLRIDTHSLSLIDAPLLKPA